MNKIIRYGLASTVLATVLMTNARAEDPVAAWNQISENAVKAAGHPPPVAALDFAIVHLAIYDAVESIDRRYEPYYTLAPNATGSLSAAAARLVMMCWSGCSRSKPQRSIRRTQPF